MKLRQRMKSFSTWGFALLSCAATSAFAQAVNFSYTGAQQTWVVPAGVTQVSVQVWGAQGGSSYDCDPAIQEDGGLGGMAQGTLNVTPGQTLYIYVGGKPTDPGNVTPKPGGFNGGGDGGEYGAGGGGASDIRVGGTALTDRVVVAGGGGGGNTGCPEHGVGGAGGGLVGGDGIGDRGNTPGGGGTQSAGGTAGESSGDVAQAGQLGLGGSSPFYHFAGGGGGYYGGGSAYGAGGGGGSSYVGGLSGGTTTAGVQTGAGAITITSVTAAPATSVPTLSSVSLALLAATIGLLGLIGLRRRAN